ncbi:uncharacterized protein C8R40DRAFT_1218802 [Lentinula edodes]|uniref:uncharacterized protein n=1 Tax=Lentinula edodes TaxID=5353 RepID=UPI001E8D9134|nr:uncharacterized protein C8R40DRAFT_1218802 [Lentinula edodes]KAH7878497.1 hypothetical protein C8R40DRAFT_1218802 [Lentinula edodes]
MWSRSRGTGRLRIGKTQANLFLMALALQAQAGTIMWFNSTNVIPLGNGRLGAQVLGQIPEEVIILNEDRIWSGSLNDPNNRNCSTNLSAFRQYVWCVTYTQSESALSLVYAECMATPISQQVYQSVLCLFVVLRLNITHTDS